MCRCTGYRPILQGLVTLTTSKDIFNNCSMGKKCCMKNKSIENNVDKTTSSSNFLPYDSSQEPIFPPELVVINTNIMCIIY